MEDVRGASLLLIFVTGCQFAGGGIGGTDADTEDTTGETGATEAGPTEGEASSTTPTTESGTTTSPTGTTTTATSGLSSSTSDDPTTSGNACDPFRLLLWAEDVPPEDTTFPLSEADQLPPFDGAPVFFLRSSASEAGRAAFSFDVPCADTVMFWGLTWDALGADTSNADAYVVGVDTDPDRRSPRWEYGCDNDVGQWAWYRMRDTQERCTEGGELEPLLVEGPHALRLRNREPVSTRPQFNFTGRAAVVVTNDPDYDPHEDYDPALAR